MKSCKKKCYNSSFKIKVFYKAEFIKSSFLIKKESKNGKAIHRNATQHTNTRLGRLHGVADTAWGDLQSSGETQR